MHDFGVLNRVFEYARPNGVVRNDIALCVKSKMADFCRRLNSKFI